jgi:hypothetical protein
VTAAAENTELLLPGGVWGTLGEYGVSTVGPVWVAVEDDYGMGAAVAAAGLLGDGRIEVDGWLCPDWDAAIDDVVKLGSVRRIRQLLVGASMLSRVPREMTPQPLAAGQRETRTGLALLRDLAANRMLVHDEMTFQLDDAMSSARVRELSSGLFLVPDGPTHLVKALVWAVQAAHKPAPVPVIY